VAAPPSGDTVKHVAFDHVHGRKNDYKRRELGTPGAQENEDSAYKALALSKCIGSHSDLDYNLI
jgi:hypothetical protein